MKSMVENFSPWVSQILLTTDKQAEMVKNIVDIGLKWHF